MRPKIAATRTNPWHGGKEGCDLGSLISHLKLPCERQRIATSLSYRRRVVISRRRNELIDSYSPHQEGHVGSLPAGARWCARLSQWRLLSVCHFSMTFSSGASPLWVTSPELNHSILGLPSAGALTLEARETPRHCPVNMGRLPLMNKSLVYRS